MTDNFTEYHSLGWPSSFRTWNALIHGLFKDSIEKSVFILMDFTLHITDAFFP